MSTSVLRLAVALIAAALLGLPAAPTATPQTAARSRQDARADFDIRDGRPDAPERVAAGESGAGARAGREARAPDAPQSRVRLAASARSSRLVRRAPEPERLDTRARCCQRASLRPRARRSETG